MEVVRQGDWMVMIIGDRKPTAREIAEAVNMLSGVTIVEVRRVAEISPDPLLHEDSSRVS